jgi:hypothetical protein
MRGISAEVIAAIFDKAADDMVRNRRRRGQATTAVDKYELSINLKTAEPNCAPNADRSLTSYHFAAAHFVRKWALSGHRSHAEECPLLGVKRTSSNLTRQRN